MFDSNLIKWIIHNWRLNSNDHISCTQLFDDPVETIFSIFSFTHRRISSYFYYELKNVWGQSNYDFKAVGNVLKLE